MRMWYGVSGIAVRCKLWALLMMLSPSCFAHATHIFISFSMPKQSIMQWLEQAKKANANVYLKGFINNSFKQTINEASKVTTEQSAPFLLDPKSFEKFDIRQVPAVVFVDDNQEPITVYGDIGLSAAANIVAVRTKCVAAEEVIKLLPS